MKVWHHILPPIDQSRFKMVRRSLEEQGIELGAGFPEAGTAAGLIFFEAITPGLFYLIRSASHYDRGRILGVFLRPSTLPSPEIWRLLQAGLADILFWAGMKEPARKLAARIERWVWIETMLESETVQTTLIGKSAAWRTVLRTIVEAARFTEAAVLLTGETGTGKELAARLIHTLDGRPGKRELIIVDCATIVPELSGSEFFGHERGAFTGAVSSREGAFALANGGTLFLDEVGELPPNLQTQLLRVIQESTFKRVGGNTWQETRFRLVCATNRNLKHKVQAGEFRQDLYYRIATIHCHLPPLQERSEDILPLARHFIKLQKPGEEAPELDEAVQSWLLTRQYPGNVRELRQLISRVILSHVGPGPITAGDIPWEERPAPDCDAANWCDRVLEERMRRAIYQGFGLKEIRKTLVETLIRIAVAEEEGNLQRAARRLGVTPRALQIRRAGQEQAAGEPEETNYPKVF